MANYSALCLWFSWIPDWEAEVPNPGRGDREPWTLQWISVLSSGEWKYSQSWTDVLLGLIPDFFPAPLSLSSTGIQKENGRHFKIDPHRRCVQHLLCSWFLFLVWDCDKLCSIYESHPFAPKSDQCQIPPTAAPEILHHTLWRTWLFIAYSNERLLYYQFSLPNLNIWRMYFLNLGVKGLRMKSEAFIHRGSVTSDDVRFHLVTVQCDCCWWGAWAACEWRFPAGNSQEPPAVPCWPETHPHVSNNQHQVSLPTPQAHHTWHGFQVVILFDTRYIHALYPS